MKEQIEQRLEELKNEYESGSKMLAELEAKEFDLKNTLLRINGAIQVLEEMLAKEDKLLKDPAAPENQPEAIDEKTQ